MPDRDVSAPFSEQDAIPFDNANRAEDEPDLEGYDETQRAEIAEVEGDGPTDGVVMTDLPPDDGRDLDEDEVEDSADELTVTVDTDAGLDFDDEVDVDTL